MLAGSRSERQANSLSNPDQQPQSRTPRTTAVTAALCSAGTREHSPVGPGLDRRPGRHCQRKDDAEPAHQHEHSDGTRCRSNTDPAGTDSQTRGVAP